MPDPDGEMVRPREGPEVAIGRIFELNVDTAPGHAAHEIPAGDRQVLPVEGPPDAFADDAVGAVGAHEPLRAEVALPERLRVTTVQPPSLRDTLNARSSTSVAPAWRARSTSCRSNSRRGNTRSRGAPGAAPEALRPAVRHS